MNSVDTLISNTLDKFNEYLMKKKLINKFISDTNFVKFQQEILSEIKIFVDSVPEQELKLICKTQNPIDYVKLNLTYSTGFAALTTVAPMSFSGVQTFPQTATIQSTTKVMIMLGF